MRRIRDHVTSAHVIAMLALFVAMGGTGYAALKLPKNSVGSKQIKKNAITSTKVKNGSLKKGDFAAGQLPAGQRGPAGPAGAAGAPGTPGVDGAPDAFARVRADGTLESEGLAQAPPLPDQNKGITAGMVQKNAGAPAAESTGPGVYCFGGLGFTPRSAMVTLDNSDSPPAVPNVQGGATNFTTAVALFKGPDLGRCDGAHGQVRVAITRVDQTNPPELVDHGFTVWFEK